MLELDAAGRHDEFGGCLSWKWISTFELRHIQSFTFYISSGLAEIFELFLRQDCEVDFHITLVLKKACNNLVS